MSGMQQHITLCHLLQKLRICQESHFSQSSPHMAKEKRKRKIIPMSQVATKDNK